MRKPLKSYRDLIAWQRAMTLVQQVRAFTTSLPRRESKLAGQLNDAAMSVPANIAEGYGRAARGEYLHFLSIANGSLKEVETEILIAKNARVGSSECADAALATADECGAVLHGLRKSLVPKTRRAPRWPAE